MKPSSLERYLFLSSGVMRSATTLGERKGVDVRLDNDQRAREQSSNGSPENKPPNVMRHGLENGTKAGAD